jgi:hypothetical protein
MHTPVQSLEHAETNDPVVHSDGSPAWMSLTKLGQLTSMDFYSSLCAPLTANSKLSPAFGELVYGKLHATSCRWNLVHRHSSFDGLPPHLNPLPRRGEETKRGPLALLKGEGQGEGSFSSGDAPIKSSASQH